MGAPPATVGTCKPQAREPLALTAAGTNVTVMKSTIRCRGPQATAPSSPTAFNPER